MTEAAALTANFPPVFSNAPLDVEKEDRYWVTDGGATDNRGMISLLLALRSALEKRWDRELAEIPSSAGASEPEPMTCGFTPEPEAGPLPEDSERELPEIHIVMADASAGSTAYVQDRGIGSKLGATRKVANQLVAELLVEIGESYRRIGGTVIFHDLSMPEFLRIDGGLGTHWMLSRTVDMKVPEGDGEKMTLDTPAILGVIEGLHDRDGDLHPDGFAGEKVGWFSLANRRFRETFMGEPTRQEKLAEVDRWLRGSEHRRNWNCLCRELTGKDCLPEDPSGAPDAASEARQPLESLEGGT